MFRVRLQVVFLKSKKYYFGHRTEKGYLSAPFFGFIYLKSEIEFVFRSFNIPQFKLKLIGARAPKKLKLATEKTKLMLLII